MSRFMKDLRSAPAPGWSSDCDGYACSAVRTVRQDHEVYRVEVRRGQYETTPRIAVREDGRYHSDRVDCPAHPADHLAVRHPRRDVEVYLPLPGLAQACRWAREAMTANGD